MPSSSSPPSTTTVTRSRRPSFVLSSITLPSRHPSPPTSTTGTSSSSRMNLAALREKERDKERHKLARGLMIKKGGSKKGAKRVEMVKGDVFLEEMKSLEEEGRRNKRKEEERRRRLISVGELTVVLTPPEETHLPPSTIFSYASPPPPPPKKYQPFNTRGRHHPPPPRRTTSSSSSSSTPVVPPLPAPPPPPPTVVIHPAPNSPTKVNFDAAPPPPPRSTAGSSPVSLDNDEEGSFKTATPDAPFEFDSEGSSLPPSPPQPQLQAAKGEEDQDQDLCDSSSSSSSDEESEETEGGRPDSPTPSSNKRRPFPLTSSSAVNSSFLRKHSPQPSRSSISSEDSSESEEGVVMRGFVVTPRSPVAINNRRSASNSSATGSYSSVERRTSYASPPSTPTSPASHVVEHEQDQPTSDGNVSSSSTIKVISPPKTKISSPTRPPSVASSGRRPSPGRISSDVGDVIKSFPPPPPPVPSSLTSPTDFIAFSTSSSPATPNSRRLHFQPSPLKPKTASGVSPRAFPTNPPLDFDSVAAKRTTSVVSSATPSSKKASKSTYLPSSSKVEPSPSSSPVEGIDASAPRTLLTKRSKSFKRFFLSSSSPSSAATPLPALPLPALPTPTSPTFPNTMQTKTPKRPAPPPPLSLYTPPSNTNSTQISNPITTELKLTVAVVDKKPSSSSNTNTTSILNRRRSASSSAPSPSPSTTTPKAEKKEKSLEKRFSVASLSGIFFSSSKKKGRNGKGVGEEKVPDVPVVPLNFRVVSTKEDGVGIVAGEREGEKEKSLKGGEGGEEERTTRRAPEERTEFDGAGMSTSSSLGSVRGIRVNLQSRGSSSTVGSEGTMREVEGEGEAVDALGGTGRKREGSEGNMVEMEMMGVELAPEMTHGPSASSMTLSTVTLPSSSPPLSSLTSNSSASTKPQPPSLFLSSSSLSSTPAPTQPKSSDDSAATAAFNSMSLSLKLRSAHFAPLALDFGDLLDDGQGGEYRSLSMGKPGCFGDDMVMGFDGEREEEEGRGVAV